MLSGKKNYATRRIHGFLQEDCKRQGPGLRPTLRDAIGAPYPDDCPVLRKHTAAGGESARDY